MLFLGCEIYRFWSKKKLWPLEALLLGEGMFDNFDIVALLKAVWLKGYQGVVLHQLLLALAIALSFVVLRKVLAGILLWCIKPPVRKFWPEFADEIIRLQAGPIQFLFIIFGFYFAVVSLGIEGAVEKIGFRSTLIRRFDKAPV